MTSNDATAAIPPVRLSLKNQFKFRCHPGISCFTRCCRGINIMLTPYDILRLKKRLGISSEEFLKIYTVPQLLEKTDLPVVTLRLLDDSDNSCPFVREDGCLVYDDRPTTCRYYPLGVAALSHQQGADDEGFYFLIDEPHCRGFEEDKVWSVETWRRDQGVDVHDDLNAEWTDLLVRKRSFPKSVELTEQSKQMFFMASYNIDQFRRFVFESSFLKRHPQAAETVERIREDEIALMQFGLRWLKGLLFRADEFARRQAPSGAP
jgi:Fe-S-cluster containining protein